MEHLPPHGWAEVATKRDLDHLAASVRVDLETLEQRLRADFRSELMVAVTHADSDHRVVGDRVNVTIGALALAAGSLR